MNRTMTKTTSLIALMLLLACGVAFAGESDSQTYMSAEEMMEKVVGHKIEAISAKDKRTVWTEYYVPNKKGKPKGLIKGTWGGEPYRGNWKVKNGMWCFTYPSDSSFNGCYYLELVDETTLKSYTKDGKYLNTLTVVE